MSACSLSGSGLQSAAAGTLLTLDVQSADAYLNPSGGVVDALGVAVVFQLAVTGPAAVSQVFAVLPGKQEAQFTLTRVGTYTVAVTASSSATNVMGSPYQITIFPGARPAGQPYK